MNIITSRVGVPEAVKWKKQVSKNRKKDNKIGEKKSVQSEML